MAPKVLQKGGEEMNHEQIRKDITKILKKVCEDVLKGHGLNKKEEYIESFLSICRDCLEEKR